MRTYKVTATRPDDQVVAATRYGGTNALAKDARDELMAAHGLRKKDVTIEPADIPTAKDGLLAFVNNLLALQDIGATEGNE